MQKNVKEKRKTTQIRTHTGTSTFPLRPPPGKVHFSDSFSTNSLRCQFVCWVFSSFELFQWLFRPSLALAAKEKPAITHQNESDSEKERAKLSLWRPFWNWTRTYEKIPFVYFVSWFSKTNKIFKND